MSRRATHAYKAAAQRIHAEARARLAARGRPTTDRPILGFTWWDQDDEPPEPWLMVGRDHPDGPDGDPVLVILESARFEDMYFVSTLRGFRAGEAPGAIALGKWFRVVEYDGG